MAQRLKLSPIMLMRSWYKHMPNPMTSLVGCLAKFSIFRYIIWQLSAWQLNDPRTLGLLHLLQTLFCALQASGARRAV